jgi:AcrR family transcriptional regulator
MSTSIATTLAEKRNDLTRRLILDTAIALLETGGVGELTMRAVAKQANISERTVFRYFATRDEFLDAIAEEARAQLALPPPPRSIAELLRAPTLLFEAMEVRRNLVVAGMHSDISDRMREAAVRARSLAVRGILDDYAPHATPRQRKLAAASICFNLVATTWHYYRFYLRLSLADTIACAETAIRLQLHSLTARS